MKCILFFIHKLSTHGNTYDNNRRNHNNGNNNHRNNDGNNGNNGNNRSNTIAFG